MKLDHVHKGIKFKQVPVLRDFVNKMAELRANLTKTGDLLGASIIKQMMCYFFGRMIMTGRNFTNTRQCSSLNECIIQTSLHTFQNITILGPNCSLFQHELCSIKYSCPILWAQVCLDMSKIQLYEGLDAFKANFPGAKLVLAQTDSLLLKILLPGENVDPNKFTADLTSLSSHMDFSTLPSDHVLYQDSNRGKIGVWKLQELDITEAISIKNSVYSYIKNCESCKLEFSSLCKKCTGKSLTPVVLSKHKTISQSSMVIWLSYLIASQKPGVRNFLGSKQKLTNSKVVSEVFPKYLSVSNTDKQIGFPSFLADDPKEPCVVAQYILK
jgi:hypothetical protein